MNTEEFASTLKALKLSQRAFAREIEYHYNQVGRWAGGKTAIPKIVAEYLRMRANGVDMAGVTMKERVACAAIAYEVANLREFDEATGTAIKCRIMARSQP